MFYNFIAMIISASPIYKVVYRTEKKYILRNIRKKSTATISLIT